MWKEYLKGYLKYNRSSGVSIMIGAFISALLLSLLCGLFYNAWKYETERIIREEGGWQSRIEGVFDREEIETVKNFANVKEAVYQKEGKAFLDLYFEDMGDVLEDTPKITDSLGASEEYIIYHDSLLSMYLVRSPQDRAPRMVFPLFLLITVLASASLIMIIHNSFAVSMNARIRQFGIFSSIGAAPKQIRACLFQEAAGLCALPVIAGNIGGNLLCMGILQMVNGLLGKEIEGRQPAVFRWHPLVFAAAFFAAVLTIWISVWIPARTLSRLTPLEAMKDTGDCQLKRRKHSPILALLFGVEGELAGNALKAQRKAMRTATLSLILSFMAFTLMECFFTLSGISTRETYFERYQDVWDIMAIVEGPIDTFEKTEEIQKLSGVERAIVYQRAEAKTVVGEDEISEEMKNFGGFSHAGEESAVKTDQGWLVNAPVVILDDTSFLRYCEQIGIAPERSGAVIRNRIRDVTNPDFRHPEYLPYLKGEADTRLLMQEGKEETAVYLPVLAYTEEAPPLREEYGTLDPYELVHFMPVSLWKECKGQLAGMEEDTRICILGRENADLEELDALQSRLIQILGEGDQAEIENRIRERMANDTQIQGMMIISGGFCVLLALIGIGSLFSNTLGFVRQRRREIARYRSVGMTPGELRKMFCIEALVMAGRPVLLTLPLAAAAVGIMLRAAYIETAVFLAEAPFVPIFLFMAAVLGSVALAYYLGWRGVEKISLAEVLKDDTMM